MYNTAMAGKFNINLGKNKGEEKEISFGGKEGDKFRIRGPKATKFCCRN